MSILWAPLPCKCPTCGYPKALRSQGGAGPIQCGSCEAAAKRVRREEQESRRRLERQQRRAESLHEKRDRIEAQMAKLGGELDEVLALLEETEDLDSPGGQAGEGLHRPSGRPGLSG